LRLRKYIAFIIFKVPAGGTYYHGAGALLLGANLQIRARRDYNTRPCRIKEAPMANRLVSADSHVMEPPDLWLKAIGARFGDRTPQVRQLPGRPG
jgi:hypothetical protein